jgi:hypothetical protein
MRKRTATKCAVIGIALFLAISGIGRAQEAASPGDVQPLPQLVVRGPSADRSFPVDVAGYFNFRYVDDDDLQTHDFYRDYSASLFLSETLGRWRFHAELNADTASEYDSDGIHLIHSRPSLSVKLDSGFANYNLRDWFQVQAGLLFIPTYWRTHRYQSTTLTVDEPLIDQTVFPTALKGGAIYGDKYWGDGGLSYIVYGGVDLQSQLQEQSEAEVTERAKVVGGKITFHLPSREYFSSFDVAFHRMHRVAPDGLPDELYAFEMQLRRKRVEVLSEFEHASLDFVNGVRGYIRQGYYVQVSYQINQRLFAVARYDTLDRDSRFADQSNLIRQSTGLTYRPITAISLKVDADRYEPEGARIPAYYGVTAAAVWFFHLP